LQVLGRDKVREGKEGTLKCLVLSCLVVVVAAAVVCVVVVVMLLLRVAVVFCCCLVVVAAALRLDLLGNFFEDRLYTQLKHRAVHRQSVRIYRRHNTSRTYTTIHSEISSVVSPVLG
jgi:Flp pilus assembly protein TadB